MEPSLPYDPAVEVKSIQSCCVVSTTKSEMICSRVLLFESKAAPLEEQRPQLKKVKVKAPVQEKLLK